MENFVELVKALAWPVAAVWLGYLFRTEIRTLLGRVTSLKHGDTEIGFSQSLAKAEKAASELKNQKLDNHEETSEELSQKELLYRLVEISPRAAVVEAWTLIETAAQKSGITSGSVIKRTYPKMILDKLINTGQFSPNSIELIDQLRQLRNKASHLPDFAISQKDAERYLDLAIKSAEAIENSAS